MPQNDFPSKDELNICFAHVSYQMAASFEKRESGIRYFQAWTRDEMTGRIGEADVLVVSGFWCNDLLDIAPRLRFIQSIGAGYDQFPLEELKRRPHLEGIDFEVFWDQGEHVVEMANNLKSTGLWGGMFAAMVLFFFLRAVRMTLIITLAIPMSLLVTIATIYFLGWTLNLITMMGLMLSLGLVVDNAIVIVENVFRKRQQGVAALEASVEGAPADARTKPLLTEQPSKSNTVRQTAWSAQVEPMVRSEVPKSW